MQALEQGLGAGVWTLAQVSRGRLDPEYRHHFYQATGWQEEVGLILPVRGGLTLMLFLGRLDKRSSLSRDELARLEALFPLVHSLCRQHWREEAALLAQSPMLPGGADLKATVEQAIASVGGASLTRRERQVAGLLLQGLDTEAIAAELGIGSGTVKNHRKHLYAKFAPALAGRAVPLLPQSPHHGASRHLPITTPPRRGGVVLMFARSDSKAVRCGPGSAAGSALDRRAGRGRAAPASSAPADRARVSGCPGTGTGDWPAAPACPAPAPPPSPA